MEGIYDMLKCISMVVIGLATTGLTYKDHKHQWHIFLESQLDRSEHSFQKHCHSMAQSQCHSLLAKHSYQHPQRNGQRRTSVDDFHTYYVFPVSEHVLDECVSVCDNQH